MIQPVSFGSEKVSGEAESLSAQKPLEEHCYGSMTIFMYLQGDAAKMGEAKRTQELNSLNLPLTSFPPGAVAAVPEGALFVVPGHTRKRAGGCQWSGAADQQRGHCQCCGCCSGHETSPHSYSHKAAARENSCC